MPTDYSSERDARFLDAFHDAVDDEDDNELYTLAQQAWARDPTYTPNYIGGQVWEQELHQDQVVQETFDRPTFPGRPGRASLHASVSYNDVQVFRDRTMVTGSNVYVAERSTASRSWQLKPDTQHAPSNAYQQRPPPPGSYGVPPDDQWTTMRNGFWNQSTTHSTYDRTKTLTASSSYYTRTDNYAPGPARMPLQPTSSTSSQNMRPRRRPGIYPCNQCPIVCTRSKDLDRHKDTRHGGPVYRCYHEGCPFSDSRKDKMQNHSRDEHSGVELFFK